MIKKILIRKEEKKRIEGCNKKVSIVKQRKYFVNDTSRDFHSSEGSINKSDLMKKDGSRIKSNIGKEFYVFSPHFSDIYEKIRRTAHIIPLKDIGLIITETGVNKNSRIIDAGSGSGALATFLASIAKQVTTYDIRDDFIEIVKKNILLLDLKNITVKHGNIYDGINEVNNDLVTLDLPEPWKAVDSSAKCLKIGGFIVAYNPSVPQISDFVEAIRNDSRFILIKIVELSEREWEFDERKIRPKSKSTIHSGFLAFARLVSKDK